MLVSVRGNIRKEIFLWAFILWAMRLCALKETIWRMFLFYWKFKNCFALDSKAVSISSWKEQTLFCTIAKTFMIGTFGWRGSHVITDALTSPRKYAHPCERCSSIMKRMRIHNPSESVIFVSTSAINPINLNISSTLIERICIFVWSTQKLTGKKPYYARGDDSDMKKLKGLKSSHIENIKETISIVQLNVKITGTMRITPQFSQ